jgi:hypothetical protein
MMSRSASHNDELVGGRSSAGEELLAVRRRFLGGALGGDPCVVDHGLRVPVAHLWEPGRELVLKHGPELHAHVGDPMRVA